jgi:hypothetical protein
MEDVVVRCLLVAVERFPVIAAVKTFPKVRKQIAS